MIPFLKFVHFAAIAVWSAGLLVLPFLLRQRHGIEAPRELDRLHRVVRFLYVGAVSPAAFVGIGTGTALIFLQPTQDEWFSLKLLMVGAMVILHVFAGLATLKTFRPGGGLSLLSHLGLTGSYLALIGGIVWIVLAKPEIDSDALVGALFEPGGLAQFFGEIRMPIP